MKYSMPALVAAACLVGITMGCASQQASELPRQPPVMGGPALQKALQASIANIKKNPKLSASDKAYYIHQIENQMGPAAPKAKPKAAKHAHHEKTDKDIKAKAD